MTFADDTRLNGATFADDAQFDGATFAGNARFDGVTVRGGTLIFDDVVEQPGSAVLGIDLMYLLDGSSVVCDGTSFTGWGHRSPEDGDA